MSTLTTYDQEVDELHTYYVVRMNNAVEQGDERAIRRLSKEYERQMARVAMQHADDEPAPFIRKGMLGVRVRLALHRLAHRRAA